MMNKFAKILAWVLIGAGALIILAGIVSLFIHPVIGNALPAAARFGARQVTRTAVTSRMLGGMSFMHSGAMFLFGLLVAGFGTMLHLIANKHEQQLVESQVVTTETKTSAKK
jgi:hypothetical protein